MDLWLSAQRDTMALSHVITIILNTINITTTNTIITKIKIMVSEMHRGYHMLLYIQA